MVQYAMAEYLEARRIHSLAYEQYGWPSPELELANRRCGAAATALRFSLGLNESAPLNRIVAKQPDRPI